MSYSFGQFRKSQLDSYMDILECSLEDKETKNTFSDEIIFLDKKIVLSNSLTFIPETNTTMKSYYLKLKIFKQNSKQVISIKLVNTKKENNNEQKIKIITVEPGLPTEYEILDFVFTPNETYDEIHLIMTRDAEDYSIVDEQGYFGRKISAEVITLADVINVIEKISSTLEGKNKLKQIGVQAQPGLLLSLQGEGIKVGRSGLYEINQNISISYIGFIVEELDENYFVMDYKY